MYVSMHTQRHCCNWFCHLIYFILFSLTLCYLKHFLMPNNDRHKSILFIAWKLNETFKHKCNLNFTFFSVFSSHFICLLLITFLCLFLYLNSSHLHLHRVSPCCILHTFIYSIFYSMLCLFFVSTFFSQFL